MKIHQLPLGARFEFDGEEYVKTGPLLGTGKGGQRFFPKYAVLKPLDDAGQMTPQRQREALSRAEVLAAFDNFYAECQALVADERQTALAAARQRFVAALG